MSTVFYNSEFLKEEDLVIKSSNRSFNYGDGFFESIKVINNKPFNFSFHYWRYEFACQVLKINISKSKKELLLIINKLIVFNNITNGSIKIHISRKEGGKYLPSSFLPDLFITGKSGSIFKINTHISLCVYSKERKSCGEISNIKSNNAIVSILASIHANEQGFDNAIILNTEHNVIEASNANIFILKDNILYTPPANDGPVMGGIRDWILNKLNVIQKSLQLKDLFQAD